VRVISSRGTGAGMATESRGPTWGGIGGPPRRLPGQGISGGSAAGATEAAATVENNENPATKDNPLLAALKSKVLAEGETKGPRAGQLYFLMEGKHKAKQIELIYKSAAGPLSVRFKE
jgi:hypothetical protein